MALVFGFNTAQHSHPSLSVPGLCGPESTSCDMVTHQGSKGEARTPVTHRNTELDVTAMQTSISNQSTLKGCWWKAGRALFERQVNISNYFKKCIYLYPLTLLMNLSQRHWASDMERCMCKLLTTVLLREHGLGTAPASLIENWLKKPFHSHPGGPWSWKSARGTQILL